MEIWTGFILSETDIRMLVLCPFFSSIGGLIHLLILYNDFSCKPTITKSQAVSLSRSWRKNLRDFYEYSIEKFRNCLEHLDHPFFIINKLLFSALSGFVVAIYFLGMYPSELNGIARIWLLCVLVGYGAHLLWKAEEQWVESVITSKLFNEKLEEVVTKVNIEGKDNGT